MRVLKWIKNETLHVVPVFIFFLVSFIIINWTETYLFEQIGIPPYHLLEIAIAAGLVAKIVLVLDHLFFTHFFSKYPLVYGIIWKTLLYWVVLLLIRLIIRSFPFFWDGDSGFQENLSRFTGSIDWNLFISIQSYYLMLLFIFVTFRELTYRIGSKEMFQLFFTKQKQ